MQKEPNNESSEEVGNSEERGNEQVPEEKGNGESNSELPCDQLISKKRAAQSPLIQENDKRDRMGLLSDSSGSSDLNRCFPCGSPNEVSFLSIELKTSTPRAINSSGSTP